VTTFIQDTITEKQLSCKLQSLGHDPLLAPLVPTPPCLLAILKRGRPIGKVLLDQSVIAGIGNYLRAEILYDAGVSPFTSELENREIVRLLYSVNKVTQASFQSGGASLKDYLHLNGERGQMTPILKVYRRSTDPDGRPVNFACQRDPRIAGFPAARENCEIG